MSWWDGFSPWPWWLWTLSALWIGAVLFWQPTAAATRERWGWGVFALVYAGLILFGGRLVPTNAPPSPSSSWLLWGGLVLFFLSAVTTIGLQTPRWQQFASGATALGAGLTLALLQAPEAALACGVAGVALVRASAVAPIWPSADALPRQNQGLAGIAAVVTLVVMIGLIRHALLVEATHIGPSRWQTVFPTTAQTDRHRAAVQGSTDGLPLETWGLALIAWLAMVTRPEPSRTATTLVEQGPS